MHIFSTLRDSSESKLVSNSLILIICDFSVWYGNVNVNKATTTSQIDSMLEATMLVALVNLNACGCDNI